MVLGSLVIFVLYDLKVVGDLEWLLKWDKVYVMSALIITDNAPVFVKFYVIIELSLWKTALFWCSGFNLLARCVARSKSLIETLGTSNSPVLYCRSLEC